MGSDPGTSVVMWFLMVLGAAVVLPVAAAGGAVVVAGRGGLWLARSGRQLVQGSAAQGELRRISHERNEAIRDVLAIRNQAERELRQAARYSVIQGTAEEWADE